MLFPLCLKRMLFIIEQYYFKFNYVSSIVTFALKRIIMFQDSGRYTICKLKQVCLKADHQRNE